MDLMTPAADGSSPMGDDGGNMNFESYHTTCNPPEPRNEWAYYLLAIIFSIFWYPVFRIIVGWVFAPVLNDFAFPPFTSFTWYPGG